MGFAPQICGAHFRVEAEVLRLLSGGVCSVMDLWLELHGVGYFRVRKAVQKLLALGLVERVSRGRYRITEEGLETLKVGLPESRWKMGRLELRVLKHLVACGRVTLKEASAELDVKQPTLYGALRRLMRRGLVRRVARGMYEATEQGLRELKARTFKHSTRIDKVGRAPNRTWC